MPGALRQVAANLESRVVACKDLPLDDAAELVSVNGRIFASLSSENKVSYANNAHRLAVLQHLAKNARSMI
jgi:hypothetical protein